MQAFETALARFRVSGGRLWLVPIDNLPIQPQAHRGRPRGLAGRRLLGFPRAGHAGSYTSGN
jgi:hypothetical protein